MNDNITEINKDTFWALIQEAKDTCGQDTDAWAKYMIDRLAGLGPDQSLMFLNYMDAYKDLSFRYGLWDAAKIFRVDGCSDDSFSYFRSWLIVQGKDVYMAALADPDSLADVEPYADCFFETAGYGWGSSTIVNILKKREYLGHTINFKTRKHFKDKKSHYVSEDEWTIFENTHEAIIDQQTFDLAQKIRSNVRRYPNGWGEAAPLTGLLYCADCGGKMYVHRTNNGKRVSQYTCSNYTKVPCGTLCPTQHRINESAVLTLVSDTLRAIAEYSRNDRTEFIHTVQETQVAQQSADISKKRRRLAAAQKRAGELEKLICKIYEDNALGKLPDARYKALDAQYAKEQDALEIEIAELEKAVTGYEQSQKSAEKFIALIDKYENFDTLTNTMLNEFVEKILVHERARKGSQDTTQEIEIYFNFLGRYIPPSLQPVPLTPEEQEELRKKEERKDRLHQNYLKRKASGAQKQYEDKIKAKKKAEMDAKKALIRAEDMKKGIFSTVGQLPKEEPRKGSISGQAGDGEL